MIDTDDDDVQVKTKRKTRRERAEMRKTRRIAAVMIAGKASSSSLEVADAPGRIVEECCRLHSWYMS